MKARVHTQTHVAASFNRTKDPATVSGKLRDSCMMNRPAIRRDELLHTLPYRGSSGWLCGVELDRKNGSVCDSICTESLEIQLNTQWEKANWRLSGAREERAGRITRSHKETLGEWWICSLRWLHYRLWGVVIEQSLHLSYRPAIPLRKHVSTQRLICNQRGGSVVILYQECSFFRKHQ